MVINHSPYEANGWFSLDYQLLNRTRTTVGSISWSSRGLHFDLEASSAFWVPLMCLSNASKSISKLNVSQVLSKCLSNASQMLRVFQSAVFSPTRWSKTEQPMAPVSGGSNALRSLAGKVPAEHAMDWPWAMLCAAVTRNVAQECSGKPDLFAFHDAPLYNVWIVITSKNSNDGPLLSFIPVSGLSRRMNCFIMFRKNYIQCVVVWNDTRVWSVFLSTFTTIFEIGIDRWIEGSINR